MIDNNENQVEKEEITFELPRFIDEEKNGPWW